MNKFTKGKLSKLALLGISLFILYSFVSCDNKSPTGPEEPPEPPKITQIEGNVVGLIKGNPVNLSKVELCDSSGYVIDTCSVENDRFSDDNVNNPFSVTRIRIRSDEAYDRETNLSLTQGVNNVFTFNMIEYNDVTGFSFEDYKTVGHIGGASRRWKTYVPKFYIYDKSLWHGLEIIGTFEPSQININRIIDVIKNDIPKLTKNFVSNPVIERESQGHPHPPGGTDAQGYVIIGFWDDIPSNVLIYTGHRDINWHIYNGAVFINSIYPDIWRGAFSEDITANMGYIDRLQKSYYSIQSDSDNGFYHGDYPYPFDSQYIAKIKYSRPPGNTSRDDINVQDHDPIGSGTSGLLLYRVEPIYISSNPLQQFNQIQQPNFRPLRQKQIEKRSKKK